MRTKSFISPNLRHKDGKIYYLNNKELYITQWNYVDENYYIDFQDIEIKPVDDIKYTIKINDYSSDVLIEMTFSEEIKDDYVIEKMGVINSAICGLDVNNSYYIFNINNINK